MKLFEKIRDFNKRLEKLEKFADGADSVRAVVSDAIEDADLDYELNKHSDRLDDLESAWDNLDDRIDDYIRDNCDFVSESDLEREVETQLEDFDFSGLDSIKERIEDLEKQNERLTKLVGLLIETKKVELLEELKNE